MHKIFAVTHDLVYTRGDQPRSGFFTEVLAPVAGYPFPDGLEPASRVTDERHNELTKALAARLTELVEPNDFVLVFDQAMVNPDPALRIQAMPDPWALIATCAEVVRARNESKVYLHSWVDTESLAPNFVLEMKARGPLKLHAFWGRGQFLASNVIDVRNMAPIEEHGTIYQRKAINWKLSYGSVLSMEPNALREALTAHFLQSLNPHLKNAVLVDGENDALITDIELEVQSGTAEEFKQAMQWLVDFWTGNATLEIQCASPGKPAAAYSDNHLMDFIEDVVLPVVQPSGFGYNYNDGPSYCKSGYTYGALCLRFSGDASAHERIEARVRFCEWLAARGVNAPSAILESYENPPAP